MRLLVYQICKIMKIAKNIHDRANMEHKMEDSNKDIFEI